MSENTDVSDVYDSFFCLECGCREAGMQAYVSTHFSVTGKRTHDENGKANPWDVVLQHTMCAQCHTAFLSHLAYRQLTDSIEKAREEWLRVYKPWK